MKVLFVSNYYLPYVSGITIGESMIAEEMHNRGIDVKVIASRHDNALSVYEYVHNVKVERCNVQFKISKGTISFPFLYKVISEARKCDVVIFQIPMLESGILSLFIKKEKLYPTYHCDINLSSGNFNNLIVKIMDISHKVCLKRSKKIFVTSLDYAKHSRVAKLYKDKLIPVGAPIKNIRRVEVEKAKGYYIGFCGRIVEEKGIDILLKAFEIVQQKIKNVTLMIAGDYKNVAGGSVYAELRQYINEHNIENVRFLGKISEEKLAEFYSMLDVFTLPSTNSLEAFGLVQIEAMMCGTPVVASDLYGVRTIIQKTGMGLICKKGNPSDLARCLIEVILNKRKYVKSSDQIAQLFSTQTTVNKMLSQLEKSINA